MNLTPFSLTRRLMQKGRLYLTSFSVIAFSGLQVAMTPATTIAFPSFNLLEEEDYLICTAGLQSAGLSANLAAQACAMSVRPQHISTCVSQITINRNIAIA